MLKYSKSASSRFDLTLLLLLVGLNPLLISLRGYADTVKLKDLIKVKGVRENPLIGFGLVIGLNGTGDDGNKVANKSLTKMLTQMGLDSQEELNSKNVATVVVTAKLPPFARQGQKIDVTISSVGNAASLAGGTLILTPLKAPDGEIYAVANGPLSIGGLKQGKDFPTTGRIPGGATVEKDLSIKFNLKNTLRLSLNNPDFTTAYRIEKVINEQLGGKFAKSQDSVTVDLVIPENYKKNVVKLIALIENVLVTPDTTNKIVINERTGTIVTGGNILLKDFTLGHKNLSIEVNNEEEENQGPKKYFHIKKGSNLSDLVNALNTVGISPEDLISIFQNLKSNGLLTAELEFI